ncbi:DUF1036 domain-containing protein [Microcoleus sp.]|uniref:DUF1036 domain-containing protein n=1 Tax=Microcoleus sp. TaxID=44472 RepID=UPI003523880D
MPSYFDSQGKSISLVKELAKGGEGTVWQTDRNGYYAKVYHQPSQEQITKLQLMIANPPQNPTAGQNHIAISWPTDLIKDNRGNWVGFLMPEIKNAKQLVYVYHPKNRNKYARQYNWYCLHIIALNLVSIIREIHDTNYVIGDISVKNILVNECSLVALIDTDSFQVTNQAGNKVYRCLVGSEGFTPPELIGQNLSQLNQTRYHDRFRLAVIIHNLLFGNHPFMGIWTGSGNPPGQDESISQGHWPYGINSLLKPSRNTIPLTILHPELKKCFLKCFNDGHQSPTSRPSPEDWFNALQVAINDLVVCSTNKNHIYSKHSSSCCWCDRAQALSVDIFPSVNNPIAPQRIPVTSSNQAMLQKLQSDNKSLNNKLAQANTQLSTLQSNNQSLNNKLAQANTQLSTLQSDNKSLNQDIQKLQSENQSLNNQLAQVPQTSHLTTQLSEQVQRLNVIKKIAITSTIISTVIATAFAGLSFFQYQERNQMIKQIEQIRRQNNLPSGQWKLSSYSLELELENFGNIVTGKNPLIYSDLNHLINKMQEKNTLSEGNIKTKKDEINTLEKAKKELEKAKKELESKNNSLQSRINELEKYTYVNFCNKTSYTIEAALTYWNGSGLLSRGWYSVESGKCKEVSVAQNYNGNVYVYGMYNRGEREWGSGKYSFCVDIVDKFSISESDKVSCSESNQKRVAMSELSVSPGTKNWDFDSRISAVPPKKP